jgi:enoyl-CoA hydratase/carnithine racemase
MDSNAGIILTDQLESDLVRVTIRKPPANALDSMLLTDLLSILRRLASQNPVPAIVLTGAGDRFFSAGGDIGEIEAAGSEAALRRIRIFHAVMCELERYPAPIVAAVRGYAVGGALEFLLFTDYVVAGDNAQFGFPEINHGLLPATKGMRQAATLLGQRAARSLLYSGRLVGAERAREIGIVDEIVAVEQVDVRAVALAREMRDKDQHLFAAIKRSVGCTFQLGDPELEQMTVDDMRAYLDRGETADARARFLNRK